MSTAASGGADSRRRGFFLGLYEAIGTPALVLAASYVGFGSLVREGHLSIWLGLASTLTGWALPGQVALVELYGIGASLAAIVIAVGLTNARLMPMVITILPLLRDRTVPRWQYYAVSHLVAVTSWAGGMRRCPDLPAGQRLPYFFGFAMALWAASLIGTAVGFFLAGSVPEPVTLGLVFLNPIYFMVLFAVDLRTRLRAVALVLGAVLGPLLHGITPDWGLMLTGLIAGTLAFGADRLMGRRDG